MKRKFNSKPSKRTSKFKRRRVVRKRRTVLVNRALQPIPQRYIVRMKYADTFQVTAPSSSAFTFRLNLNSIFDPNRSGGGHQPYGHDTFSTLYNRYRVISCRYAIQVQDGAQNLLLAVIPSNEEIPFGTADFDSIREEPRAKYVVQNVGAAVRTLRGKVYIPSLMGRNKSQYMADDRFQAVFGADPAELAILNCFLCNTGGGIGQTTGTNPGPRVSVLLTFVVELFDQKVLAQS